MTKETKIGLLVGLAFIILFAIILSEKGAGPRPGGPAQFTEVDSLNRHSQPGATTVTNAGRLPLPVEAVAREAPKPRPRPPLPAAQPSLAQAEPTRRRDDALPTVDPSLITRVDAASERPAGEMRTADAAPASPTVVIPPSGESRRPDGTTPASPSRTPESAIASAQDFRTLQGRIDAIEIPPPRPHRISATAVENGGVALSTLDCTEAYTVQPGDTLTSIARKTMGSGSAASVAAIFKANSATLKNEHSLKVGQTLNIPSETCPTPTPGGDLVGPPAPTRFADAGSSRQTSTRTVERASTRASRTYEVRPRDTLSKIAKRELGSSQRYKEIEAMNRDVLGRRGQLQPGMKLKLPPRTTNGGDEEAATRRGGSEFVTR